MTRYEAYCRKACDTVYIAGMVGGCSTEVFHVRGPLWGGKLKGGKH